MTWHRFSLGRLDAHHFGELRLRGRRDRSRLTKAVKRGPQPGSPAGVLVRSPHPRELNVCETDMDERLRIEFNDWARAGRGAGMEKGHRPVGEQGIELMALPAGARVLDVGCGSGWATRLMAEKASSGRVVGIDIADEMVKLASETSTSFSNVEFQVASAEKLPFSDAEFTHAFSMESL